MPDGHSIARSPDSDQRPTSAERTTGLILVATIAAIAVVGLESRAVSIPSLRLVSPIAFFVAALANAGTAAVLWTTWRHTVERRSSFVLGLTFVVSAGLTFLSLLMFPTQPGTGPIFPTDPRAGVWIYLLLQIARVAGALGYALLRFRFDGPAVTRRFRALATAPAVLMAFATLAAIIAGSRHVIVAPFGGLGLPGVAELAVVPLAAAAWATIAVPRATTFDRAFALSLLALAIDAVLFAAGPRFSGAYYGSHILLMLGALIVFTAAVESLVSSRARLSAVETRLATIESESAVTAGRIRALWRIASDRSGYEDERFLRILESATTAIRPGLPLIGVLSHLNDETLVIDATASTITGPTGAELAATIYPGATFAFERTLLSHVQAAGVTRAWNDVAADEWRGSLAAALGCRSLIATPVAIARRTYFLTFASPQAIEDDPFAEDEIAFVDVVAAFIASYFTQQMHFERIRYQIEHDALTGLENRVQFRRRVRDEIATGRGFIVAFANLDGFRHVNESQGHQMGDEILVEVAAGLRSVDEGNSVARTSGDEFGLVIRNVASAEEANAALERYAALFREPFHTGDREGAHFVRVTASIGASRFPTDGRTAEQLMLRSDAALVAAKARGRSATMLFDEVMEAALQAAQLLVNELSDAIAGDQLALVYQPTFDLATRAIVGAEALVRWDHPERGRILPAHFVPFAERNGLIEPLSRWVLDRLVRDLTQTDALPPGFRVYFNLAANLLENFAFISAFEDVLRAAPGIVAHIGVEVTETAAMQNVERSMSTIELFRRWGLSVAIDDFGTGYSSLSYLKQLTVDAIKIDQSFIAGLPDDERDAELADMLIRITDRFGFLTLAEGIETEAQATWLLDHGCRLGQGYLMARPAPFEELLRRLVAASVA